MGCGWSPSRCKRTDTVHQPASGRVAAFIRVGSRPRGPSAFRSCCATMCSSSRAGGQRVALPRERGGIMGQEAGRGFFAIPVVNASRRKKHPRQSRRRKKNPIALTTSMFFVPWGVVPISGTTSWILAGYNPDEIPLKNCRPEADLGRRGVLTQAPQCVSEIIFSCFPQEA